MANKPPAFQLYAQDWFVGTSHLTLEEQGAYLRLLCRQWVDGPLPNDSRALARMVSAKQRLFDTVIWPALSPFFPTLDTGRLANPRLEKERVKQEAYRARQAVAGRISGKGRREQWLNQPSNSGSTNPSTKQAAKTKSSSSSSRGETPLPPLSAHAPQPNGTSTAELIRGVAESVAPQT